MKKDILYINSVEDIRLVDMLRISKKEDPYNGYAYVDLGLPSGTLWATMNVGANSETDYGLYFAWGETQGYADASSGKKFSWDDYKWGTDQNLTKYNSTDNKTQLDLEDDAAAVNMGGQWHMPTQKQIQELLDNTTITRVTDYNGSGINGILFTSKTDINRKLFIPSAGNFGKGSVYNVGDDGGVWSSSLTFNDIYRAMSLELGTTEKPHFANKGTSREVGLSVRGVITPNHDTPYYPEPGDPHESGQ